MGREAKVREKKLGNFRLTAAVLGLKKQVTAATPLPSHETAAALAFP